MKSSPLQEIVVNVNDYISELSIQTYFSEVKNLSHFFILLFKSDFYSAIM